MIMLWQYSCKYFLCIHEYLIDLVAIKEEKLKELLTDFFSEC